MPGGAIASIAIQIQPQAVVSDAVVIRQRFRGRNERFVRYAAQAPILGGQARFKEFLFEERAVMLAPGHCRCECVEQLVSARHPTRHDVDPRTDIQLSPLDRGEGGIDGQCARTREKIFLLLQRCRARRCRDR